MADTDGNIKLSVSLQPTDIKKSAANLQKAIAGVFDSTKGKDLSKPVEKLQISLDKASNRAESLIQKMTALEREIPTQAYFELDTQIKALEKDYIQLSKAAQDPKATSGTKEALEAVKQEYTELLQKKQELVASGKGYDTQITDQAKYDALGLKLSEVNNQTLSLLNTYRQISTEEEGASQAQQAYNNALDTMAQNATTADQEIIKLVQDQEHLQERLNALYATRAQLQEAGVTEGTSQWEYNAQAIARTEQQLEQVNAQVDIYREKISTLPAPKEPATFTNFIKFLGRNLVDVGNKARTSFGQFVDSAAAAASQLRGNLSGALNRVKSLIGKTFNGKSIKHGFMTVLKYTMGIRSLYILFNKLRAAVKQAINNMAQWNDGNNEVNRSMTEITSSLTAFKNSVGVAVAPLLNALAPALVTIIDLATAAANAIGRFFAALTGASTVMQAVRVQKDYAQSLGGTASGSKKAAKETDKLHDKLAAFDDLNVLGKDNDSDSGAGGGGGAGSDIQGMFKEIDTPALTDKLKEAIESGDFSSIGQAIGEKIRDGLNGIDWEGIREDLSTGISMITSFINGLFTTEGLFASVGTNLAEGLNTIVGGLHQVIKEIKWKEVFKGFGEGISKFFSTLDFGEILLTIGDGLKSALEAISGFLEGVDLSEVLDNVVAGIKTFFQEYEWADLFKDIGNILGDVSSLIAELVIWLGEGFGDMLINFDKYFSQYIDPQLEGLSEDASWVEIAAAIIDGILIGIGAALVDIGTWIYDNIFTPIYDGICEAFEINSPSKVMEDIGGYIIEGLLEGLKDLVSKVAEPFIKLKEKIAEIWGLIKTKAVVMWTLLKTTLVTMATNIKTAVTTPFTNMKTSLISVVTSMKNKIITIWQLLWSGIKGVINNILEGIESFCNGIIDGINSVLDLLDVVDDLPDAVKEYVGLDDFTVPQLEHISIPRLADGAVIPPNREFLAVLGDQKNGTNIEAPLDTIVEAFRQAMGSQQSQDTRPIILQVDGQTLGRIMTPRMVNELGRLGYNVKVLEG